MPRLTLIPQPALTDGDSLWLDLDRVVVVSDKPAYKGLLKAPGNIAAIAIFVDGRNQPHVIGYETPEQRALVLTALGLEVPPEPAIIVPPTPSIIWEPGR